MFKCLGNTKGEVSGRGWWGLALGFCMVALSGCGGPDERLMELGAQINALDGQMKLGETREVPLPPINSGEWIVAIGGQYSGVVCPPSPLPKKAEQRATLDYGNKEIGANAYLLLVSGDDIRSDVALPDYIGIWQPEKYKGSCALIADHTHRSLVVECMKPVSDKPNGRACEVVLRAVK